MGEKHFRGSRDLVMGQVAKGGVEKGFEYLAWNLGNSFTVIVGRGLMRINSAGCFFFC